MDAVFGDNARSRAGVVLALYLLVLACMGTAYLGGKLLQPMQRVSARVDRFWARGIPSAELAALSPPASTRALESLTRELASLGEDPRGDLSKAARRCLGGEQTIIEQCRRLEHLATARLERSRARRDLHLKAGLGVWAGAGLLALICGALLFRLLGRASRAALGLSLLGFLSLAAMEVSAQLDRSQAHGSQASLDSLEMKIRLNLEASGQGGRRRLASMARTVPRLIAGQGKEARALMRIMLRCRKDALVCPRVLTPLTRYQQAVRAKLEPPRSRARLRGWLQMSALMVLLLVPFLGALDRRK